MRSMILSHIAQILHCRGSYPSLMIRGVSIDSRSTKEGDLFFALPGEKVDGHSFLKQVFENGGRAAVVSLNYQGESHGLTLLPVENPLDALQHLAKTTLTESSIRVVAITGSVGKTSTKEFVKDLLSTKYRLMATPGNYNSQIGLPLAILNHTTGDEEIFVLEMGMTLPGHIARLVQIAPPEVALITTVALVHAENFETIEEIALAKGEIFSHPATQLGILDRGISNFTTLSEIGSCSKKSFTIDPELSLQADYHINLSRPIPLLSLRQEKKSFPLVPLSILGKHNYHNLLGAIAVAHYFNIDQQAINEAISSITLPAKRLEPVFREGIVFINDSYNAAEKSVKSALEAIPEAEVGGRKIAVLGSMLELGKFSEECHRHVGEFALNHVERMYCLGEESFPIYDVWKKAGRPVQFFLNRADLMECLDQELKASDVVLLKGSSAHQLWKILER